MDPKNNPNDPTPAPTTGMTGTPTGPASASPATGGARSSARDMKQSVKSTATGIADEARHQASDLAGQARDAARDGASRMRDEADRRAQAGIDRGADEVSNTARALRTASDEVDGTFQGQLLRQAADGLTEISDNLRGKSIGDIAGDIAEFGRRNPVAFLGGAALAGFAIARFARASQPSHVGDGRAGPYAGPGPYGRDTMPRTSPPAATHTPPSYPLTGQRPASAPGTGATTGASTSPSTSPSTGTATTGGARVTQATSPTSPAGVRPATTGGAAAGPSGSTPATKGKPND